MHGPSINLVMIHVSTGEALQQMAVPYLCTNVAYNVSRVLPVEFERMSTREAECLSRCLSVESTLNTIVLGRATEFAIPGHRSLELSE